MSDETIETRKNRATLYKKIAAVTAAMQRIPKNGRNTFHNYKYATESDLTDGIRELLNEHGLAFLPPTVLNHERIPIENSKQGPLTRVQMQFTLACCDTGETVSSVLWADGQDAADKGFYKAYTGGVKYFLMKTFLVATGDDPEQDQPQQRQPQQEQERKPVQGPQPRTSKPNAPAPTTDPAEAQRQFFTHYGKVVGATSPTDWYSVWHYLGEPEDIEAPTTAEQWREVARLVVARQKNASAA